VGVPINLGLQKSLGFFCQDQQGGQLRLLDQFAPLSLVVSQSLTGTDGPQKICSRRPTVPNFVSRKVASVVCVAPLNKIESTTVFAA